MFTVGITLRISCSSASGNKVQMAAVVYLKKQYCDRAAAVWVSASVTLLRSTTDGPCSSAGNPLVFPPNKKKKKENNTELSASILHPGTVFIWITPPNPLSNDMTQWVTIPQILLWEKHQVFGSERLKMRWRRGEFFKWISEEQNIGMITARRICITTGSICESDRITLTHLLTAEAEQCSSFCRRIAGTVHRFSPKPYQHECVTLARPWPHPLGVYLELARERETVQHSPLGAHEEADVSEEGPNGNTRFKTMDRVCVCEWDGFCKNI